MPEKYSTLSAAAASLAPAPHAMTRWDRLAQSTTWGRYITDVERRAILQGVELAAEPGRAVDLGCGGGRWSKLLASQGWRVTALDVNPQALAICQRNVPSADCQLMSPGAYGVPLADACAELALCIEVIPLIEAPWFIAELRRILSPRGVFVGVYINGRSLRGVAWRMKRKLRITESDEGFYRNAYAAWRQRLMDGGFELLHEESFCWGPFSRDSNSPFVPACAKVERVLGLNRLLSVSPWIAFVARKTELY